VKPVKYFCAAKIQSLLSCLYYKRDPGGVVKLFRFSRFWVLKRDNFRAGNQIFWPDTAQIEVCIFKIIILAPYKNLL
jgi:hypothetical protein